MPHVSKRRLSPKNKCLVADKLTESLITLPSKKHARDFTNELLTKTEALMLGKRLTLIFLLTKGTSWTQIEDTLGVTPQTIDRINRKLSLGLYKNIVNHLERNEPSFINLIDKLLSTGAKMRSKNKWDWLDKY